MARSARHDHVGVDAALLANRVALGLYFAIAAFGKIKPGLMHSVGDRLEQFAGYVVAEGPRWVPDALLSAFGYALPVVELILAAMLIVGLFLKQAAAAIAALMVVFILGYTGLGESDAGHPFHENVIFLTLALMMMALGAGRFSVDAIQTRRRRR